MKVLETAFDRQIDRIYNRLKSDYFDKSVIQRTLDDNYISLPDNSRYVASRCGKHPLAGRLITVLSTPGEYIDSKGKKGCDIKKLQPAKKVLEEKRCKFCGSKKIIKWGRQNGHQRYRCKDCDHVFMANQKFPRMRGNYKIVATALDLYFEGLSLRKVSRQIKKLYGKYFSQVTIWNWIQKYTPLVRKFTQSLTPQSKRGIWHVDETAIRIKSKNKICWWYWDCIDHDSRFIVVSHISEKRFLEDNIAIFKDAKEQTGIIPSMVICDGLVSYRSGLIKAYSWSDFSKINFISAAGIAKKMPSNNNRIERYHNTIKERTKIMRGMQNPLGILDGFTIHYNFIRRHQTLKTTPARIAGIRLPFEDGWGDLIQFSTIYKTRKNLMGFHGKNYCKKKCPGIPGKEVQESSRERKKWDDQWR